MTRLWQKYALALILAALLPLAFGAWRLATRGTEEVAGKAKEYQSAAADAALIAVTGWLNLALVDLRNIAGTVGNSAMSVDDRLSLASGQLNGAKSVDLFVIYSPTGEEVQTIQATNADNQATIKLEPPRPLPEALRQRATDREYGLGQPTQVAGVWYLPVAIPIRKPDGSIFGFAWTALDMTELSTQLAEQSRRRFAGADDQILLIDRVDNKDRVLAPVQVTPEKAFGTTSPLDNSDFQPPRKARTMNYTAPSGQEMFGSVVSVDDLGFVVVTLESRDSVYAAVGRIYETAFIVGGAFAVLALLIGVFGGKRLSAPITAVSSAAGKVAAGDFTVRVPVAGKDEVADLGKSFNQMTAQLTDTIQKLQETTAAKERMQTELAIGHNIQMSMVPLNFPAFPERPEFDIHAALKPAFEVGGDFYDFFLVDEDTLCVCIADVSGKGVPAALFMAVTRTLVKTHATGGLGPDEILEKVNDDLAKDNEACMFVTVFLGLLKLSTGELTFTNAGHNPSYIKRKTNNKAERLEQLHGPVVAAMEEIPYASGTAQMNPGDTLVLYTDGVNEAMNIKQEIFTEERLAKLIENKPWDSSAKAVDVILDDVWKFQGAADQADDVTVVALRYLGKKAA